MATMNVASRQHDGKWKYLLVFYSAPYHIKGVHLFQRLLMKRQVPLGSHPPFLPPCQTELRAFRTLEQAYIFSRQLHLNLQIFHTLLMLFLH